MVAVLGLGSLAAAREPVAGSEHAAELRSGARPDSAIALPPAAGAVGEDPEPEESSGTDDVAVRTDARAALRPGCGSVATTGIARELGPPSYTLERRRHIRGPPLG